MVVTKRLDKNYIDILKNKPPPKPLILETHHMNQRTIDKFTAYDEVDRVLLEYLQCHSIFKGYAGPAGGHRWRRRWPQVGVALLRVVGVVTS